MAGLAAIFRRDGTDATAREVEALAATMPHRGVAREIVAGPVALASLGVTRSTEARTASRVHVAWHGRLDDAAALASRLGLRPEDPPESIVAAAYLRWGRAFPDHLLGPFAAVVWDPARCRVVLARGALGLRPLYYHLARDILVVASELRAVLDHPAVPVQIDEGMVGEVLAVNLATTTDTLYRAVKRLAPGHTLTVTSQTARGARWWHPPGPARHPGTPDVWAHRFETTLADAVRCRIRDVPQVGVHLSGGFDSTAVNVLLAEGLAAGQQAASFGNVYPGRACDERSFMRAVTAVTGLPHHDVPEPGFTRAFFADSAEVTRDLPSFPGEVAPHALRARARAAGTTTLLTGYGGDETTYPLRAAAAGLLARGRLHDALALTRAQHAAGSSARAVLRGLLAGLLPPHVRLRLRGDRAQPYPWMDPRFAAAIDLPGRLTPKSSFRPPDARALLERLTVGWSVYGREQEELAAARQGIDQRHPFLDRRVVELALQVPTQAHTRPREVRPLLARGVGRRYPEAVLRRRDKAAFDHNFVEALRALEAYDTWPSLAVVDRGWVDADAARALHAAFRDTHAATGRPGRGGFALWAILSLELWWRRLANC